VRVTPADDETAGRPPSLDEGGGDGEEVVRLTRWTWSGSDDDPHANFKSDVTIYGLLDPLVTLRGMSANLDIPVGALARYVLAKWATGGSGGLLELGPVMVRRLWEPIHAAEEEGTDQRRLAAYHQLRQMISWLNVPLDDPSVYPAQEPPTPADASSADTSSSGDASAEYGVGAGLSHDPPANGSRHRRMTDVRRPSVTQTT
jgi:Family of unknown function (DUF6027)